MNKLLEVMGIKEKPKEFYQLFHKENITSMRFSISKLEFGTYIRAFIEFEKDNLTGKKQIEADTFEELLEKTYKFLEIL